MDKIENFADLFLNDVPMMDVRAPVEFARGSFPAAVNIPLLNDSEREQVGTAYKKSGQDAAVALGHQLVCGDVKAERVRRWKDFAEKNPRGCLFCFRGGMRSHIVQQWLKEEAGIGYPLVKGGYKAMRRFLIDSLEKILKQRSFITISGRTGIGKTLLIHELENALDLEALANHRGSSFGRRISAQPSQINFENALAIRLLKLSHASQKPIFVEDESRLIGRCALPPPFLERKDEWPVVMLEDTLENRITHVQKDYVTDMLAEHRDAFGADGFEKFSTFLRDSLGRIRKRLGGLRHDEILVLLENALDEQARTGDESLHRVWIEALLVNYYDPMYDYQLSQKERRVAFKGNRDEVLAWCLTLSPSPSGRGSG